MKRLKAAGVESEYKLCKITDYLQNIMQGALLLFSCLMSSKLHSTVELGGTAV